MHGLVVVSPLGYTIAHLGVAFARLGGIHTLFSISFVLLILFMFRARKITLSLGSYGFCPGVDLILPCLTITLISIQVLPTDGANYRDWI